MSRSPRRGKPTYQWKQTPRALAFVAIFPAVACATRRSADCWLHAGESSLSLA